MGISTKKLFKIIVIVILVSLSLSSFAQMKPDEEYAFYKSKYPNETAVYIEKKETVDYSIIDDSIITTVKVRIEMIHLGDNNVRHSVHKVYSSNFNKISNLKAYTLVPKKKKYEKIEVTEFKESYDKSSSVFYDDTKEISFTFPAIQKGVKTIIKYTRTTQDPRLVGMFFLDTYLPVDNATYKIIYDNKITIIPQIFNTKKLAISRNDTKIDQNRAEIVFKSSSIKKIKFDVRDPSYNYLASSIYCPINHYITSNGGSKEVISTTESLHQWYRTFILDLHNNDDDVKKLVESIIDPQDSVMEKVKKIYYWVQSNIKYIAFEDGMRGLIPHEGNYVISKRYGDCKDMASTIVSMLREAGLSAQYTWVGSRELPYKYSITPSPIVDNHMIATFSHKGVTYFLDATGQYTPIDLPTSMIQGKECLISNDDTSFEIIEVPIIPKEKNLMVDSINISLDNGSVKGNGVVTFTGYAKVFNTYKLINSNKKRTDDYVKRLLEKGNNKFHMLDYKISFVKDLEKPINIDYNFRIEDYYSKVGDNIYINLALDKTLTDAIIENRTVPFKNEYKYMHKIIVEFTIPDGYKLETVPKGLSNSNDNFGFDISYESLDSKVVLAVQYYEDYLIMEPKDFESWNSLIKEYAKASRRSIILVRDNKL